MSDVLVPVLVVAALLLLNALFVAAEFAIVGVPRPAIERLAEAGQWQARLVAGVLRDPRQQDRYIATAQLGITLASLGLGMYGEHLLAEWIARQLEVIGALARIVAAHTLGSVVAVAVLTYFHIVIGEMVPKSLALGHAERTALWVTPPMRALQIVAYPLIVALNGIGNAVLRAVGVRREASHAEQARTPEELAYIVREAQQGGLLRSEQARVVAELLDFGERTAAEVMVPRVRVQGIPLGADPAALRALLAAHPFTRYPVFDGTLDRIVGMLHVKDVLRRLPHGAPVAAGDARPVPFIPSTATMEEVIAALRSAGAQMAVVMDEHGGTAGILTAEDLFEEIVGDVGDEPVPAADVVCESDTRARVRGTVRLDVVGDSLGLKLEHEEVDTVSGLVLSSLGRPPRVGDTVEYAGVRFTVTRVEGHGVAEAVAELMSTRRRSAT